VLLDFHEYAQSVFLQGRDVPWHQPTAYSNFFGAAQGLLKPDVALLDLGSLTPTQSPPTTAEGSYGREVAHRVRTEDHAGQRDHCLQGCRAGHRSVPDLSGPLVLQIPSPMLWLH